MRAPAKVLGALIVLSVALGNLPSSATSPASSAKPPPEFPWETVTGRGAFFFDTQRGEPNLPMYLRTDLSRYPDSDFYILQFVGPVRERWVREIRALGVAVLDYLPYYSFVVEADPAAAQILTELPFVRWVGRYHPAYKVSPVLLERIEGLVTVIISVFPTRGLDRVRTVVASSGLLLEEWIVAGETSLLAEVPASAVVGFAHLPEVSWIEPMGIPSLLNENAAWVVQTNNSAAADRRRVHLKGITGAGQLIAFADTGLFVCHEMFRQNPDLQGTCGGADEASPSHRKVYAYLKPAPCSDGVDTRDHGTPVAGTLAGDAPQRDTYTEPKHDGHAFGGKIIIQDIEGPDPVTGLRVLCVPSNIYENLYNQAFLLDSKIHSNTWGTTDATTYGSYCLRARDTDRFMWDHKDFLALFAAGNVGPGRTTVTCEASAKSVVTVGATQNGANAWHMWSGSSRGPTIQGDERWKPTVVAPGQDIWTASATFNDATRYAAVAGTSIATPAVAGSAALVRQYFQGGWYPRGTITNPSAALVKATLVNSAVEIGGNGAYFNDGTNPRYPNNDQGWGRIHLDNALEFADDTRKLIVLSNEDRSLSTWQQATYHVKVTNSAEPLGVTLGWTDYPASSGANPALVNDLNLLVIDPQGNRYHGNRFSGCRICANPAQSIPNPARTDFDNRNVEEGVLRLSPSRGVWTIKVIARNVPNGPQPFALVSTGAITDAQATLTASVDPRNQTAYEDPVCGYRAVASFKGMASGGIGSYVYVWDFGDGGEDSQTPAGSPGPTILHTYPWGAATWTVRLAVAEAGVDGTRVGSVTATVVVEQNPFPFC